MRKVFLVVATALILWQYANLSEAKSVKKRATCSGGGCNDCEDCGEPCSSGNCNSCEDSCETCTGCNPQPEPVRTCSQSCGSRCSNQCNSRPCFNSCVRNCGCENESIEDRSRRCCQVLHPKSCYTDDIGKKRCVVRRHRECSNLCTSSVVSIQEGNRSARGTGCRYVRSYPYAYCGNYETHDCGQCFNCEGGHNARTCSQTSQCSDRCRRALPYY